MLLGLEPIQKLVRLKYQAANGEWIERLTSPQIGLLTVGFAIVATIVGSLIVPDDRSNQAVQTKEVVA